MANVSDPYLFTVFLLERAMSKGVNLMRGKASSLSIQSGRVTEIHVACADSTVSTLRCDNVVIAAGPWTGPISKALLPKPIPVTSYAGHSIILRPSTAVGVDCLFLTVHTQNATYSAEVIPRSSGEVYISGINDTLDLPPTPDAAIPHITEIDKLKEIADTILPSYTIEKEQLCFRAMTEHGKPFIGPYPGVAGVFVGAGHSHFGIILGPGTGKVLSEMILGEDLSVDVSQFSIPR
jgi:glycine/D-amino acid oxidase-like deaminating enzyme